MKKSVLILMLATVAGTVLAASQEGIFKQTDTDKDGFVSKDEFMAIRAKWDEKRERPFNQKKWDKQFAEQDANKDGKLTLEEVLAAAAAKKK